MDSMKRGRTESSDSKQSLRVLSDEVSMYMDLPPFEVMGKSKECILVEVLNYIHQFNIWTGLRGGNDAKVKINRFYILRMYGLLNKQLTGEDCSPDPAKDWSKTQLPLLEVNPEGTAQEKRRQISLWVAKCSDFIFTECTEKKTSFASHQYALNLLQKCMFDEKK